LYHGELVKNRFTMLIKIDSQCQLVSSPMRNASHDKNEALVRKSEADGGGLLDLVLMLADPKNVLRS